MKRYNPRQIEPKWQQIWRDTDLYATPANPGKDKYYCLVMFPYPSGNIHVGHWYNFGPADTVARFHRMLGKKVLHPIGFDAFGLPAENAAIRNNIAPAEWTWSNIERMTTQIETIGAMYDWNKVVNTATPDYYRWTQWLFLKLHQHGLAYRKKGIVNWCPKDQTVLANEQVVGEDNVCERCGTPVVQKDLMQWYFKITDYAERLLEDAQDLDWPERVKTMQANWIGRSKGAEITFKVSGHKHRINVFTTRPDTIFGATFMVLAPEHPAVQKITSSQQKNEVSAYIKQVAGKTELERKLEEKVKTGVFSGAYAINPATKKKIPIWISDFVLMSYGHGAIMAVPGHDQRDYDFATRFKLPIKQVVVPMEDDSHNPPKEGLKNVRRDTVIVHLKDKSTGKYALLNWHGSLEGITTAIMGGIEGGLSAEEAALKEIEEEAAIGNASIVHRATFVTGARYCASHKKENRTAIANSFLAEVDNLSSQGDIPDKEKALHTLIWVDEKDVYDRLTPDHQKLVWQQLHNETALSGEGEMINSAAYNGMSSSEAREKMVSDFVKAGFAKEKTQYRIRDWLISRQRYWGAPIPIVYCKKCGTVPVPSEQLPVELPRDVAFEPTGQSPLKKSPDFVNTLCPQCGRAAERETDTMDTFVDSSWYFLRYPNSKYGKGPFDPIAVKAWLPVDHYIGGIEHAILHLLYSRFVTKALHDHAGLTFSEPFRKLSNQGIILGPDGLKMSKSKGNVVDPDEQVASYGADALRLYLMFMGPYDQGGPYDMGGIAGTRRFIERLWKLVWDYIKATPKKDNAKPAGVKTTALTRIVHKTVKKVTNDLETMSFNTAVAALMELVGDLRNLSGELIFSEAPNQWHENLEILIRMMAPLAPHVSEELWAELGNSESVHVQPWPVWDHELIKDEFMTIVVQVDGRVRANLEVDIAATEEQIKILALAEEKVAKHLEGEPARTIYVPGRLINFVS